MLKRSRSRVHIASFEEGKRSAQVTLEFDASEEVQLSLRKRVLKYAFIIVLFPIFFPIRVIWYIVKNIIND